MGVPDRSVKSPDARRFWRGWRGIVALALVLAAPVQVAATPIDLGLAGQYTVFGLGATVAIGTADTVDANQATIVGNVAIGAGTTSANRSGYGSFQKGFIDGDLVVDTQAGYHIVGKNFGVTGTTFGTMPAPPPPPPESADVDGTGTFDLTGAVQAAIDRSSLYAGLGGTALGAINDTSLLLSAGVYSATSLNLNSDVLTISGGVGDSFVLNVQGDFVFSQSEVRLTGGILIDNVLFNIVGSGTTVDVKKGTSIFLGTLLAVNRDIIISELGVSSAFGAGPANPGFRGRIIGALDHELTVHSGAQVTGPAQVAEPPVALAPALGVLGLLALLHRRAVPARTRRSSRLPG